MGTGTEDCKMTFLRRNLVHSLATNLVALGMEVIYAS